MLKNLVVSKKSRTFAAIKKGGQDANQSDYGGGT